jgi:cytochrome c oxidase subunit II
MEKFLGQWMPVNASEHGPRLDAINSIVHWLMLILFIGWGLYYIYVLYRFNAKRHPRADYVGARTHMSSYLEGGVAVIELILLLGFSIPIWYRWTTRPPRSQNPLEIRVVGEQFAWNIHYPGNDNIFGRSDTKLVSSTNPLGLDPSDPNGKDDIATLNQLHLEVNRPVVARISSKDVIHSFKLPVMRVTQDATPGLETPIHFKPVKVNKEGETWEIACAQLCGLGHYRMKGQLFVHSREDFQAWMRQNTPENPNTPALNPVPEATPAQPVTQDATQTSDTHAH